MCEENISQEFNLLAMAELELECCKAALETLVEHCRYNMPSIPKHVLMFPDECPRIVKEMCGRSKEVVL